jgi:hypothetical protein
MNTSSWKRIIIYIVALILIIAVPGEALSQAGGDDEPRPEIPVSGDPAQYPDVESGEGEGNPPELILAQAPNTMNYQGYLTDTSGAAYNGNVDIIARLYNSLAAGTLVWGPETINAVPVDHGLFEVILGAIVPLYPDMFDEALFLELTVNGTIMPRQPLRASAYSLGLVPGVEVDGTPANSDYGLYVYNRSTAPNSRGIYASGFDHGLYAVETGTGDTAIYSPDFIHGRGFRSNDDSYLWIAGAAGSPWDDPANSQLIIDAQSSGTMKINARSAAGTFYFYLPISAPSVLFGQNVTIEQMTLYYSVSNAASYITEVSLEKGTGANASTALFLDTTDLNSVTATSVNFTPSSGILDMNSGWLMARFVLTFASTSHGIYIGGIRLRLGHR